MKVPFMAIFEYLKSGGFLVDSEDTKQTPEYVLHTTTGISEQSISNYCNGLRSGDKKKNPQYPKNSKKGNLFDDYFNGLCVLLRIDETNYHKRTVDLIRELADKNDIDTKFIDYPRYVALLESEDIPTKHFEFTDFIQCIDSKRIPVFYKFIYEYITLLEVEGYRDYKPSHRINNAIPLKLKRNDSNITYMPQSLIDPNNGTVVFSENIHTHTCDFSFFVENPLIIITGPGGQGKTTFFKALLDNHYQTHSVFDEIIYLPLVNLLYAYQKAPELVNDSWIEDYIELKYSHVDLNDENHTIEAHQSIRNKCIDAKILQPAQF